MIVVEGGPFLEPQIAAIPVIPIVFEHDHIIVAKAFDDVADDSRCAGSGAANDADYEWHAPLSSR